MQKPRYFEFKFGPSKKGKLTLLSGPLNKPITARVALGDIMSTIGRGEGKGGGERGTGEGRGERGRGEARKDFVFT